MAKVVVYHSYYGCGTGCCGHMVEMDDGWEEFRFTHPYSKDLDHFKWAQELVRYTFGEEHVDDLDWDNCLIVDD